MQGSGKDLGARRAHVRADESIVLIDVEVDAGHGGLSPLEAHVALGPAEAGPLANAEVMLRYRPLLGPPDETRHVLVVGRGARLPHAVPSLRPRYVPCFAAASCRPPANAAAAPQRPATSRRAAALLGGRTLRRALAPAAAAAVPGAHWAVARRMQVRGAHAPALRRWLRERPHAEVLRDDGGRRCRRGPGFFCDESSSGASVPEARPWRARGRP